MTFPLKILAQSQFSALTFLRRNLFLRMNAMSDMSQEGIIQTTEDLMRIKVTIKSDTGQLLQFSQNIFYQLPIFINTS